MVAPGNSAAFRSALWSAVERLLERVLAECRQAEMLRRQLAGSPLAANCLPVTLLAQCGQSWEQANCLLGKELQAVSQGINICVP